MVQFVLEGSHRAHQMIDDLYSFATVGEGEQQKEEVNLLALAQDSLVDLVDKIKASGAEIHLNELSPQSVVTKVCFVNSFFKPYLQCAEVYASRSKAEDNDRYRCRWCGSDCR